MENIVGVIRGTEKFSCFKELLTLTNFSGALLEAHEKSKKGKDDFAIAIKPNMMVFVNPERYLACVTDKDLVEDLTDYIRSLGFRNIFVCEAQNDVGVMLKNHNVRFVSEQIGYEPRGRYEIIDLTLEAVPFKYFYKDKNGKTKYWKDEVGKTWKEADFRITFAKCKTHEHDWMTLGVKNIYGCFPSPKKVSKYHIKDEVWDVTARSILNFPVHFSLIDAWIGSDGFQGYKICNPKELKMLFGGNNAIAVDMEVFKRAGLDAKKSKILKKSVDQLYDGVYPQYRVKGDENTFFSQLCKWENIPDKTVEDIDVLEEIYIAWGIINLKPISELVDYNLFPPKNFIYRVLVWFSKKVYIMIRSLPFYKRLYKRRH